MIFLEIAESLASAHQPAASLDPEVLQRARLELAVQETLRFAAAVVPNAAPEAGLTVLLSDDEQLRQLNRQFLGNDEPTDVLSFPAGHIDPDTDAIYLGDVIVSYPRAAQQAAAAGHAVEDELRLLAVHGVLHLLGYDHADPQDEEKMWKAQEEIIKRIKRKWLS